MAENKPLFAFSLRTLPVPGETFVLKPSLQGWKHGRQLFLMQQKGKAHRQISHLFVLFKKADYIKRTFAEQQDLLTNLYAKSILIVLPIPSIDFIDSSEKQCEVGNGIATEGGPPLLFTPDTTASP